VSKGLTVRVKMYEVLFESPTYLYAGLGLALFALAALWYERRSNRLAWALLVPVALAVVLGVVEHLVVTDREEIVATMSRMARAVETGRCELLLGYIDDDFTSQSAMLSGARSKTMVSDACRRRTEQWSVSGVKIARIDVELTGRQARAQVVTMIHFGQGKGGKTPIVWDVLWANRGNGWKVLEVVEARPGIDFWGR